LSSQSTHLRWWVAAAAVFQRPGGLDDDEDGGDIATLAHPVGGITIHRIARRQRHHSSKVYNSIKVSPHSLVNGKQTVLLFRMWKTNFILTEKCVIFNEPYLLN